LVASSSVIGGGILSIVGCGEAVLRGGIVFPTIRMSDNEFIEGRATGAGVEDEGNGMGVSDSGRNEKGLDD